jgi:hypothetical protein
MIWKPVPAINRATEGPRVPSSAARSDVAIPGRMLETTTVDLVPMLRESRDVGALPWAVVHSHACSHCDGVMQRV